MKKLMIGLVTMAAVVGATALPATAAEWFNGGVAEGWPTATSLSGGAWVNTESAAFADGAVEFTKMPESALTFVATEAKSTAEGEVAIDTTVAFTQADSLPYSTAKAAVAAKDGYFYVLEKPSQEPTNVWQKTDIVATETATVKITFPSATTVNYTINGSLYSTTIKSVETVQNVRLYGPGKISALTGALMEPTVTVTPQAVTGASTYKVYTNDTVEVTGAGEPTVYTVYSNAAVKVVYTADAGYEFAGGAATWTTSFTASAATVTVTIPEDQKPTQKPAIQYVAPVYKEVGGITSPTNGIKEWVTLSTNVYTVVGSSASAVTWGTAGATSWYVVTNVNVTLSAGASCAGAVHLILADGAKLTAQAGMFSPGIKVDGATRSLTIYGQSAGTGELIATGSDCGAGIGGGLSNVGANITINGGTVTATGVDGGAGIGGGSGVAGSDIVINGGTVTATGGSAAAGVGGGVGGAGSNITINGGTVTATSGEGAAGVGSGKNGSAANNIFVADNVVIKADNNNPPTTVIEHASITTDIASLLADKRYVKVETPVPTVQVTPQTVTGASTYKVYTNDTVEVIGEGNPPVYTVVSNAAVKVVYTADKGYEFPDYTTEKTVTLTASKAENSVTLEAKDQPIVAKYHYALWLKDGKAYKYFADDDHPEITDLAAEFGGALTVAGDASAGYVWTLTNFAFTNTCDRALRIEEKNANIKNTLTLVGENSLVGGDANGDTWGIFTAVDGGDLVINGSGSLTVRAGNSTSTAYTTYCSIGLQSYGKLTIENATVKAIAGKVDAISASSRSIGICVYNNLELTDAEVTGTADQAYALSLGAMSEQGTIVLTGSARLTGTSADSVGAGAQGYTGGLYMKTKAECIAQDLDGVELTWQKVQAAGYDGWSFLNAGKTALAKYVVLSQLSEAEVTFDAMDGAWTDGVKSWSTTNIVCEKVYTLPETAPTRANYEFLGWFDSWTNGAAKIVSGAKLVSYRDHSVYAQWQSKAVDPSVSPEKIFEGEVIDGGKAVILSGAKTNSVGGVITPVASDFAIPDRVGTGAEAKFVTVIAVDSYAKPNYDDKVSEEKKLTSVSIPSFVTRIGNEAFQDCQKMTNVTFSVAKDYRTNRPTTLSIGPSAFAGIAAETLVFPAGSTTRLSAGCFAKMTNLREIYVYGTLTNVKSGAFTLSGNGSTITVHLSPTYAADAEFVQYLTYNMNTTEVKIDTEPLGQVKELSAPTFPEAGKIAFTFKVDFTSPWGVVNENSVTLFYSESLQFVGSGNCKYPESVTGPDANGVYTAIFEDPSVGASSQFYRLTVGAERETP